MSVLFSFAIVNNNNIINILFKAKEPNNVGYLRRSAKIVTMETAHSYRNTTHLKSNASEAGVAKARR
jgi:hypothetical protein